MPEIAAGVLKFQNEVFPKKKDLFQELDDGQSPTVLFITCSDSRISPSLITQTDPGDLFICRNAGNIIPPHSNHTGGMTASIEYAVAVLNVTDIVICGHSRCGAMVGAMDLESTKTLPHVHEWLGYARAAVQITEEKGKTLSQDEKVNMLIRENVLLQLQHLKTHPYVATHLATNKVKLHGWVYDIKTGAIDAYNEEDDAFQSVESRYAKEIAHSLSLSEQTCEKAS